MEFDPFAGGEIERVSPTTAPQKEILTSAKVSDEANTAFNEAVALNVKGTLDENLLRKSFASLVSRHEALNATFSSRADEICLQYKDRDVLSVLDFSQENPQLASQKVSGLYKEIAQSPMDLENGPLIFSWLIKMPEDKSIIVIAAHHLICDGWSFGILLKEISEAYNHDGSLEHLSLAPSFFSFADQQHASQVVNKDEDYWNDKFSSLPVSLNLPLDRPRPSQRSFEAGRLDYTLSKEVVAIIPKLAASLKVSVVNVALSAYFTLLQRLTSNTDLVVGLPVAGQASLNQLDLVGHLVQLLPIRINCDGNTGFDELVSQVKTAVMDATEHPDFTFGNLVKHANVERNRVPLVSVLFNMDQAMPPLDFGGLSGEVESIPRAADSFELFLNFVPGDEQWLVEVTYSTALFDESSVMSWMRCYEDIIKNAMSDVSISLDKLRTTGSEYENQIAMLKQWNATDINYPLDDSTIDSLVGQASAENHESEAIIFENTTINYAEFNRQVNQLASKLIDEGLQFEQPVAVLMHRSEKMPIVLTAIMKAGGAYLPLDPEHPIERIAYILEESKAAFVIVDAGLESSLPESSPHRMVEELWNNLEHYGGGITSSRARPDGLAYIIYTSGSTGKPKGVMVEHRSICNRLFWMQERFSLGSNDRVLQKTPYTFDVSVWEFFMPLTTGACLVMARPEGHRDPDYLIQTINELSITLTHFVPSMLSMFLLNPNASSCTGLKKVVCSGEALSKEHEKKFLELLPDTELHNYYGPTEAAVEVTTWQCQLSDAYSFVPIGRAAPNTKMYILDEKLNQVPIGAEGELYIGGVQVARGYINNQELTDKVFIDDPFTNNHFKLYRTGDLARFHDDGVIEYLGRNDFQVKIRGLRIELGEIETVLNAQEHVAQAVVVAKQVELDTNLVAFIAYKDVEPGREALVLSLSNVLPAYMLPQHFVFLNEIPLTSSGKADRKALLALDIDMSSRDGEDGGLPKTEAEIYLAELWQSLLSIDEVYVDDNFFDIGGHSLLAVNATVQIKKDKGRDVPLQSFMSNNLSQIADKYIANEADDIADTQHAQSKKGWFSSLFKS